MEKLLTTKEVCKVARVTYPTLDRWLKAGTFPQPVSGQGRKMRWSPESIETWLGRSDIIVVHIPSPAEEKKALRQRQKAARDAVKQQYQAARDAAKQQYQQYQAAREALREQ